MLSQVDRDSLVRRARSLQERAAAPGTTVVDEALVERRLARWRSTAAGGDEARFAECLAGRGWGPSDAARLVATETGSEPMDPGWSSLVTDAVSWRGEQIEQIDGGEPLPFGPVIERFVGPAATEVERRAGSVTRVLSEAAAGALHRHLAERLCYLAGPCLLRMFATRSAIPWATTTDTQYRQFIRSLADDGLWSVFAGHPVLGRLVAATIRRHVDATVNLCARLRADEEALAAAVGVPALGRVAVADPFLSSPMDLGREVVGLTFESGRSIVYKARSLELEGRFHALCAWLNARGLDPSLRAGWVLEGSGYGFMEAVEAVPMADNAATCRYYRRAGALLAVFWLFGGTDFHHENVIACGEYPVPIDLETLFHPRIPRAGADDDDPRHRETILATQLLPVPRRLKGVPADPSGLGAPAPVATPTLRWQHVNTDAMALRIVPYAGTGSNNIPILDGQVVSPRSYRDEVLRGFRTAWELLATNAAPLTRQLGPIFTCRGRFLYRNTDTYRAVMARVLQPRSLADGVDASIEMDALYRLDPAAPSAALHAKVVELEQRALWRGSIPRFAVRGDGTSVTCESGGSVEGLLSTSARADTERRLATMDERECAQHCARLEGALEDHEGIPT